MIVTDSISAVSEEKLESSLFLFHNVKLQLSLLRREVEDCGASLSGYSGVKLRTS